MAAEWVKQANAVAQGRYFVRRGAVNYADWDWKSQPFVCSISLPDSELIQPPGQVDIQSTFRMELVTVETRAMDSRGPSPGLNDDIIDQLFMDAEQIIDALFSGPARAVDQNGDPIGLRLIRAAVSESSTQSFDLQGIVVSGEIAY